MRILSIDGGGYLGLAAAAFIDGLEKHFSTTLGREFELFCGTSTGAIIALAVATGMSGRDIIELYKKLGRTVFQARKDVPFYARRWPGLFRAKFALEPLHAALDDAFGNKTLGDILRSGKKVLVTSYSVTAGHPRIFKTNHSHRLTLHNDYRISDIALASAAAPTYFPVAHIIHPTDGTVEAFCDGGVVANHPALLGFAEAVCELNALPADIKLLSISTPRSDIAEPSLAALDRGVLGWRSRLPDIMIDSPSKISHELLRRLITSYAGESPLYERIDLRNHSHLPFDRVDDMTTQELLLIGAREASSNQVRARLTPFVKPGLSPRQEN